MNRLLLFALLVLVLSPRGAQGQDLTVVRQQLQVTPDKLYPSMIRFAERAQWDRLQTAIATLDPLLQATDVEVEGRPGEDLARAAEDQESQQAVVALLVFARAAIHAHLMDAMQLEEDGARRQAVRQAFADYLAIEPRLKADAFQATRDISNAFRRLHSQTHDPAACMELADEISSRLNAAIGAVRNAGA